MDKDEMQRILDTYDPTGRRIYGVRDDLTLDFYEGDVRTRYNEIWGAMELEVMDIEYERG
jgi:hypothetical protein